MNVFKFKLLSLQLDSEKLAVHFFQIISHYWKTHSSKVHCTEGYEISLIPSPVYKLWKLGEQSAVGKSIIHGD